MQARGANRRLPRYSRGTHGHQIPPSGDRNFCKCVLTTTSSRSASVSVGCEAASAETVQAAQATGPSHDVWELDFCSRPMLDVRGKKVWELLICDPTGEWVFSRYMPNNKINSTELKGLLKEVLATPGATKPSKVLFFRAQMQTIISRALEDLDIKAVPSRRCFTLQDLLTTRLETVYKVDDRFSEAAGTMFQLDLAPPMDIADALRGEQWAFVQLPLSALREELKSLEAGTAFGATLPSIDSLKLSDDVMLPGVAVFSKRAAPLAAWTNGLELACLKADVDRSCLLLETGVRDRYRYGAWRRSKAANQEADAWEAAKGESKGVHFLAVQTDPDAPECTGLWVLRDAPPPDV